MISQPVQFRFELTGDPNWEVRELTLSETLGRPFEVRLLLAREYAPPLSAEDIAAALEGECSLAIDSEEGSRVIPGKLQEFSVLADSHADDFRAEVLMVPALALAGHTRHSRTFPEHSVKDVVDKLLRRHLEPRQRKHEWTLQQDYPIRELIVQYEESDLDFMHRLLEEAGITYHFKLEAGDDDDDPSSEQLVLDDSGSSFEPVPVNAALIVDGEGIPTIPFIEHDAKDEGLLELRATSRLTIDAVERHVFDWETDDLEPLPAKVEAEANLALRREHGLRGEQPPGTIGAVEQAAALALRRHRQRRGTARGRGTVPGFAPGRLFATADHGLFLITAVTHRGEQDGNNQGADYVNEFECLRVDTSASSPRRFVPERRTAKPKMAGPHTALVVGANAQDHEPKPVIHTDAEARVKVRFHWVRDDDDDGVFAWLRVAQTWSGNAYGFVFVPRVGMEVVVDFLGGDPDAPMVVGCVYDGRQIVNADPLRESETRSWIRTRSEDGTGFHELLFDDAQGQEFVHFRSQKDMHVEVLDNQRVDVGTNHDETIGANRTETIKQNATETVFVAKTISVGAAMTTTVGAAKTTSVGAAKTTSVGGPLTVSNGGKFTLTSGDDVKIEGKKKGELIMKDEYVITCGKASITLKSSGEIEIKGTKLNTKTSGDTTIVGAMIKLNP